MSPLREKPLREKRKQESLPDNLQSHVAAREIS
jgi:hypothetical protein